MYKNKEPDNCTPPGTHLEQVAHPGGINRSIEKAIIMEHRFAFFFWMKWRNLLADNEVLKQAAPTLITIDWHRDLAPVPEDQKKRLTELDQKNLSDVANYVWAQFDQTNDGHILCATWLNLIGDIILLQNTTGYQQSSAKDMNGNDHNIFEFSDFNRFQEFLLERKDQNIFFDIDLDYFVHGKGKKHYSEDFNRYSDKEIRQVVDISKPVFQHILPNIDGLTMALEPGYCGGIVNACQIMDQFHAQLFTDDNEWKHL